jgi:putative hydrolase of the HAD superfamily
VAARTDGRQTADHGDFLMSGRPKRAGPSKRAETSAPEARGASGKPAPSEKTAKERKKVRTSDGTSIRAVLFDFYQTIVEIKTDETPERLWQTLASLVGYRGARVTAAELRELYRQTVETGLATSSEAYPELDVAEVFGEVLKQCGVVAGPELPSLLAQLLRSLSIQRLGLFPESREVLETLRRHYRLGLVSDSQELYIEPELRATSLEGIFEVVVISSQLGYRKPERRMFQHALDRMGLRSDEVVYVGDSWDRDMAGARDAGIRGVWVCRCGGSDVRRQAGDPAIAVISDLRGLQDLLGVGQGN